ncbi:MAG: hypothetical protein HC842_05615 [Cytophagales bacterium]|nr:hypothetical protein [Cytophagales bacterium]
MLAGALSCAATTQAAKDPDKKWVKRLEKMEAHYDKGDYKHYRRASKQASRFNKKVSKKLGTNSKFLPMGQLRLTRYQWALGYTADLEKNVDEAISLSRKINGPLSSGLGKDLLLASSIYMDYGNYLLAQETLEKARTMPGMNNLPALEDSELELVSLEIKLQRGFYADVLSSIDQLESEIKERAVRKVPVEITNKKGEKVIKQVKLEKEEVEKRLGQYGRLQVLRSATVGLRGDFSTSDSLFMLADRWIAKNLNKKSPEYINYLKWYGEVLWEHRYDIGKDLERHFESALKAAQRVSRSTNIDYMDFYCKLIKAYSFLEYKKTADKHITEYATVVKKSFGKKTYTLPGQPAGNGLHPQPQRDQVHLQRGG